jgi:hypothetical protein
MLDEFPGRLAAGGAAEFLPFPDSKCPEFLVAREFLHNPVGAILDGACSFHKQKGKRFVGGWQ